MNSMPVFLFLIYSAFSINLLLQCGLGIKGTVEADLNNGEWSDPLDKKTLIKSGIIFFTVILMWIVFSKIVFPLISGIALYILLFPVSFIVYDAMEYLVFRYVIKIENINERSINFYGGITAAAVFLCMNIADNIQETLVLSLGFTLGIFFIKLIIREVRRRASLEAVPVFLRGKPLVLITMGLLSLIFTSASILLFRMI